MVRWSFYVFKNHGRILATNSFITYHKNDLEISMITTVHSVSQLNSQIKRYHKIKF